MVAIYSGAWTNTRSCPNIKSCGQLKLFAKIVLMTNLVGYGFKT